MEHDEQQAKAQSRTPQIRRSPGSNKWEDLNRSEIGTSEVGSKAQRQSERVVGASRTGGAGSVPANITGKILNELIGQQLKRKAEAEECIKWYERELDFATQKLAELEQLKASIEEDAEEDSE